MKGETRVPSAPIVLIERGRKVLRVNGFVQSVEVAARRRPDVWDALIPRDHQIGTALLLGVGGGTVATLLTQRFGGIPITGVDSEPAVVAMAKREFGLGQLENVHIVIDDAFRFASQARDRYDLVCVDLYHGRRMPQRVVGQAFLRDVARMLAPGGIATFNFWRIFPVAAYLQRIRLILRVARIVKTEGNAVVHCSARPRGTDRPRVTGGPPKAERVGRGNRP